MISYCVCACMCVCVCVFLCVLGCVSAYSLEKNGQSRSDVWDIPRIVTVSYYRIAGNTERKFIWLVCKKWSKKILAVFNLAVAKWVCSLFLDNAPPINQNHLWVVANYGDVNVHYKQMCERTPCLQALLDPNHRWNVRLQKVTWEPYKCTHCDNDGKFHYGRSYSTEEDLCGMLTISAPKRKLCSRGQRN